jgi:hypothetical protein
MSGVVDAPTYITAETKRLNEKKIAVDAAFNAQTRNSMLNESYRKRYSKYVEILAVLVIGVILYLGIAALPEMFPVIPGSVADALSIVLVSGVIIYIVFAFIEIFNRSKINYDEVDLPPVNAEGKISDAAGATGMSSAQQAALLSTSGECSAATCCPAGTVYNTVLKTCISTTAITTCPAGKSSRAQNDGGNGFICAFTTLEQAYATNQISVPMQPGIPVPTYTGVDGASGSSASAMPTGMTSSLNISMF